MRDWNLSFSAEYLPAIGLDLTYEGLKQKTQASQSFYNFEQFGSYLWGIETQQSVIWLWEQEGFGSYLWGIETKILLKYGRERNLRLDLTYEGLKLHRIAKIGMDYAVWILPMRDWNRIRTAKGMPILFSLDLTYEGLKPECGRNFVHDVRVWILPMRDWNKVLSLGCVKKM